MGLRMESGVQVWIMKLRLLFTEMANRQMKPSQKGL